MYFKTAFLLSMVVSAMAMPTPIGTQEQISKRAALTVQNYSQFQVSNGVGGNALAEVQAKFPVRKNPPQNNHLNPPPNPPQINENSLASVDPQDLAIIKAARKTAENAETKAGGFNEAIAAAGGTNSAQGKTLQVGKIKNKVLKLKLFSLALQIDQARGRNVAAKLADTLTKLGKNIELDQASAGQASASVNFQGSSRP